MSFKVGPLILQENANLVEEVLEVLLPCPVAPQALTINCTN